MTYFESAFRERCLEHASVVVRASRSELKKQVGGMEQKLSLGAAGIEHSQELSQTSQGLRGETTLGVPKCVHLQSDNARDIEQCTVQQLTLTTRMQVCRLTYALRGDVVR